MRKKLVFLTILTILLLGCSEGAKKNPQETENPPTEGPPENDGTPPMTEGDVSQKEADRPPSAETQNSLDDEPSPPNEDNPPGTHNGLSEDNAPPEEDNPPGE